MNTPTQNRATTIGVLALGLLVATLLAALLSSVPAGADVVPAGNARSWGDNYFGQLGNGASGADTGRHIPGAVRYIDGVRSMKAGCAHGLALKTDGTVRAWGDNSYGQLGDAAVGTDSNVPVETYGLGNVKAISAGCNHNLALKENGSVWAWGDNEHGQIGNGFSGPGFYAHVPVRVASLGTGVKAIAAGREFSLALMKDGTVRSWGDNGSGQLGNGTNTPRSKPGSVGNLSNVRAIAADSSAAHALALLESGKVKSWGDDEEGQLGNGSDGNEDHKPVAVVNLTGAKAIAAGNEHSLALLGSGRVKSWGDNEYGQLGNGNSGPGFERSVPGAVSGLTGVRSISGGGDHSLAVLEGGRVRAWGDNEYGQLGNGASGSGAHSPLPVAAKYLTNVRNLDGGYEFSLAATQ